MTAYEYQEQIAMLKGIAVQANETANSLHLVFELLTKIHNLKDRKEVIDMGKCGSKKKGRKGGCKGCGK